MYRNIEIDGVNHRANLGMLLDHRITIKGGEIFVSADLNGHTEGAEFEATFTGRGVIHVFAAPAPEMQEVTASVPNPAYIDPETTPDVPETIEETRLVQGPDRYNIGPLVMEPGDDLKIARAPKLSSIYAELDALDQKLIRPTSAIVTATAAGAEPPTGDVAKIEELEQRKTALRAVVTQINAAETVEDVEAVSW
jgi:hypothetical protein